MKANLARWRAVAAAATLLTGVATAPVAAQAAGEAADSVALEALRRELLIEPIGMPADWTRRYLAGPASSFGTPGAYGAEGGAVFAALLYQQRTRYTELQDAAAVAGFGLGSAAGNVGLEVALTSYSTFRSRFGETGGISFKLHRSVTDHVSVAAGVENLASWGLTDGGRSAFGVGSHAFRLREDGTRPFSRAALSIGVGNGRYRSERRILADEPGIGVFGSVALIVLPRVSAIADWTGQDLQVGASASVFRRVPVTVTAGFSDVTGRAGDGARFMFGVATGMDFHRGYSRATEQEMGNDRER
jgi:hypothetical protein